MLFPESKLGSNWNTSYGDDVTRFLRFVGLLNAAVWLGATLFFAICMPFALNSGVSQDMMAGQSLNYHVTEVWQLTLGRLFYVQIVCAILAVLHLVAEWLYLGRTIKSLWRMSLFVLFIWSLAGSIWFAPKLRELNRAQYTPTNKPEDRQTAAKAFRYWHGVFVAVNVLMIGGITLYFWRVANPPDEVRFVGSTQFRG